jgi:tripartite-type tricarboxylate transporter receptor subunit TctC
MKKRFSPACLVLVFLLQAGVSMSHAQEPYYKGKTIRFLVNFSAGGPTDVFGRLIARYFPKHVAGNPSVTVQNMAGAGGIIGANYVYEIAKPDGLTIGVFSGMYLPQILGGSGVRYDLNKMPIIAGAAETSIVYIRTDTEVKSPADLLKPVSRSSSAVLPARTTKIWRCVWRLTCWVCLIGMSPVMRALPNFASPCSAARSTSLLKV